MAQPSIQAPTNSASAVPRLRRVLTLWDLIFYGIVLIMPIAPVPMFGVAQQLSHGHFVTTISIAMIAMMLTAVSYGRMATLYPTASSACWPFDTFFICRDGMGFSPRNLFTTPKLLILG